MQSRRFAPFRVFFGLTFCLCIVALARAQSPLVQNPSQPAGATFTSNADLVLIPVVVLEGKQHVTGLTKDDFKVMEDGHPQKIAFARATTGGTELKRVGGDNLFSNQLQSEGDVPRLTVIAIDTINTSYVDRAAARQQIVDYLARSQEHREPTALIVFTLTGIQVIHDFTTDPNAVAGGVQKATSNIPDEMPDSFRAAPATRLDSKEMEAFASFTSQADQTFDQYRRRQAIEVLLRSLQMLAQSFAGIPARKTLVWVTGSVPFPDPTLSETRLNSFQDDMSDLQPLYERTMKQLSDANVAIYPVDLRGVVVRFPGADAQEMSKKSMDQMSTDAHQDAFDRVRLRSFAEQTGGRACYGSNDLAPCFERADSDSENYYLVGYYRDRKNNKPGWRSLKVSVKHPGAEVIARKGYFYLTAPADTKEARQSDIESALVSPVEFTGIQFSVHLSQAANSDPKLRNLRFQLQIPPSSLMADPSGSNRFSLEVVATASAPKGEPVDKLAQTIEGNAKPDSAASILKAGASYSNVLRVPAGEYTLRFIVRDNLNGRTGSVVVPYTVR